MQRKSREPQPPTPAPVSRPWSALAFYGFGVVIAIDIVLAGMLNPDRGQVGLRAKLVIIFGGFLVWALWIARRLGRGAGVVAAYSFLGTLSAFILIGAMIQLSGGHPDSPPAEHPRRRYTSRAPSAARAGSRPSHA